jgi:hypothetical protein
MMNNNASFAFAPFRNITGLRGAVKDSNTPTFIAKIAQIV